MELLFALSYFSTLTSLFLWRLLSLWGTTIPGGLEDTRLFLWNAWWFHYALNVLHTNPFTTSMLFHPFGASLISHDFPLWMSLITHAGQALGLSMIAASTHPNRAKASRNAGTPKSNTSAKPFAYWDNLVGRSRVNVAATLSC